MHAQEGSTTEALIAAVLPHAGEDGMRKLIALFGGDEIQIPVHPTPSSPLVRALGPEIAGKVHAELRLMDAEGRFIGRQRFYVPNRSADNRAQKIREMLLSGASTKEVRAETGVSRGTICAHRRKLREKGLLESDAAPASDEVEP